MALNFPNSPTNGQLYTDTLSGNSWTWDSANTCWKSTSTYIQTITVSSSAPGTPAVGQLWWNRDYGRLLVYYSDGDTSQWVDASPSDYTSQLAYNQANAVSIVANNAFANTSGTFNGNLTVSGNVIANKQVTVTYTPATTVNAAITLAGANTQGGTGYADFLKATNLSGGTNPHKIFRLNSTGGIEVINSAYSAIIWSLSNDGYITKPYQPAFMARKYTGTGSAIAPNSVITYDHALTNISSSFNISTGRFTAPIAGRYIFFWNTIGGGSSTVFRTQIRKNGSISFGSGYVFEGRQYSGNSYPYASCQVILELAVGDYTDIYFQPDNGSTYLYADTQNGPNFGGYLLG